MSPEELVGRYFMHYKGTGPYRVVCIARHVDTKEPMVIYKPVAGLEHWCRPWADWTKPLDDGSPRFRPMSDVPTPPR